MYWEKTTLMRVDGENQLSFWNKENVVSDKDLCFSKIFFPLYSSFHMNVSMFYVLLLVRINKVHRLREMPFPTLLSGF